jgi:hypothetical protein
MLSPHKRWATVHSAVDCVSVKIERVKIWPDILDGIESGGYGDDGITDGITAVANVTGMINPDEAFIVSDLIPHSE